MAIKRSMNVVGIMSGTSVDGVDYVLCSISAKGAVKYKDRSFVPFPTSLRNEILKAASDQLSTYALGELHFSLGKFYADQLKKVKTKKKWMFGAIGLHGQTVFHHGQHATWQMGSPYFLKSTFNAPVVYNFREEDVALGGHGAPLAPLFHFQLLSHAHPKNSVVAFHNLGGISNVSWMKSGAFKSLISFDTGPANMLMDQWIVERSKGEKLFDSEGRLARQGLVDLDLMLEMAEHPYFNKPYPKSCGREEFGSKFLQQHSGPLSQLSLEDGLATLTELTAYTIAQSYAGLGDSPEVIYMSGGGAKNKHLLKRIQYRMPTTQIATSHELDWPVEAIEGGAFAFLAWSRLREQRFDLKTITGCAVPHSLGVIL